VKKICLIVNPAAAGDRAIKEYEKIKHFLDENADLTTLFSEYPKHSIELAKSAVLEGVQRIISFGGDGTHNEVLNGILQGAKEKFSKEVEKLSENEKAEIPSLGFVSIGSGNDLRKTLKLPKDIKEAFETAIFGKTKWIDAGYFEFKDFEGKDASRYFINILGGGFSGTVTMKANQAKKTIFKNIVYLNALLKTLIFSSAPHGVLLNGDKKVDGKFFEFDISNGKYFGGGMLLSPNSELDDGYFNVSVFRNYTGVEVLFKIYKLYNGTITKEKKLYYEKAKEVYIECSPKALLEADGEVIGFTPIKVKIVENAVQVAVT
jgi:YegS/Rv2252/BmrU family lipid kinase